MTTFLKLMTPFHQMPQLSPTLRERFKKLIPGGRFLDLCLHCPTSVARWHWPQSRREWKDQQLVHLKIQVVAHQPGKGRRSPAVVRTVDPLSPGTAGVDLIFFAGPRDVYWQKMFPIGKEALVAGKLERTLQGSWRMVHPELRNEKTENFKELYVPVYPLTAGLTQKMLCKTIRACLAEVPPLPEWISPSIQSSQGWPSWYDSVRSLHYPQEEKLNAKALERLAYDELLAHQVALALIRYRRRQSQGRSLRPTGTLTGPLRESLPFSLTQDQEKVLQEISQDMASPFQMMRLLQGDVGSGKTLVALMAMAQAVEAGTQAVLLAPTEILARQHAAGMAKILDPFSVEVGLLIGKQSVKEGRLLQEKLAQGTVPLVVGTHALLEAPIQFKNLGLVVIDEQHRFGVNQRLQLVSKGSHVDVLSMTATPIPRTLQLTSYGDMEVSRIFQKPAGRSPIKTSVLRLDQREDLMRQLARPLMASSQVYWVCPLVEESEALDLAAAQERYETLAQLYGEEVVLVHGKMKGADKEAAMEKFRSGVAKIMVATTVIEVGVDVPQATIMVIEHAERFGLSQLHQLRGRVGRGKEASSCVLLAPPYLGEVARARLEIFRQTEDGFRIAEMDLRLRGAGEISGTKQSGLPEYRFAQLIDQEALVEMAQQEAQGLVQRDPTFSSPQGRALRLLIQLLYPLPLDLA